MPTQLPLVLKPFRQSFLYPTVPLSATAAYSSIVRHTFVSDYKNYQKWKIESILVPPGGETAVLGISHPRIIYTSSTYEQAALVDTLFAVSMLLLKVALVSTCSLLI